MTHNTDILIKLCRDWKVIKEAKRAKFYRCNSLNKKLKELLVKRLKTQAKSRKKLKQNPEKTQKTPTQVEFRWRHFFTNPKVFPILAHVVNF